jgi:hypothetical protein
MPEGTLYVHKVLGHVYLMLKDHYNHYQPLIRLI